MQKQHPVCAAIDIGSNTVRLVVARSESDHLDILEAAEELVRIGESVNATGSISTQKLDATIAVLRRYKDLAKKHSAGPLLVVATEAIRKATNRAEFLAAIQRETGLEVHIIEGMLEATLTFYGATYGLTPEMQESAQIGVMDLGGGSTEFIVAQHMQITWRTSLSVGSGLVHDRYLNADPPTPDDIVAARAFLHTYLRGVPIRYLPPVLIATGGSANALLLLARSSLWSGCFTATFDT